MVVRACRLLPTGGRPDQIQDLHIQIITACAEFRQFYLGFLRFPSAQIRLMAVVLTPCWRANRLKMS